MAKRPPAGGHVVGGRRFVPVSSSTLEHDFTFFRLCREASLDSIELLPGESAGDCGRRIMGQLAGSGHAFRFLGLLLVPEEVDPLEWTPALMESTAEFFGKLSDPKDKAIVTGLLLSVLIDFFPRGISSFASSPTSSDGVGGQEIPTTSPKSSPECSAPGDLSSSSSATAT